MKKLTLLIVLCFPLLCFAQGEDPIDIRGMVPLRFPASNQPAQVMGFNSFLVSRLPGYHIVAFDTSGWEKWRFTYRNDSREELNIYYDFREYGTTSYNSHGTIRVERVRMTAKFVAQVALFNGIFGQDITPQRMNMQRHLEGTMNIEQADGQFTFLFNDADIMHGNWTIDFERRY